MVSSYNSRFYLAYFSIFNIFYYILFNFINIYWIIIYNIFYYIRDKKNNIKKKIIRSIFSENSSVGRIFVLGTGGRVFKPHFSVSILKIYKVYNSVVEYTSDKRKVIGSNPFKPINF